MGSPFINHERLNSEVSRLSKKEGIQPPRSGTETGPISLFHGIMGFYLESLIELFSHKWDITKVFRSFSSCPSLIVRMKEIQGRTTKTATSCPTAEPNSSTDPSSFQKRRFPRWLESLWNWYSDKACCGVASIKSVLNSSLGKREEKSSPFPWTWCGVGFRPCPFWLSWLWIGILTRYGGIPVFQNQTDQRPRPDPSLKQ